MPAHFNKLSINRILDANINRAREGLRVCEEISRFILNDKGLTFGLKTARHRISSLIKKMPRGMNGLLKERESGKDIGKNIYADELKRKGIKDLFFANIQRVKESLRVLEEFLKLHNTDLSLNFKKIRYGVYDIEKKAAKKIEALRYR